LRQIGEKFVGLSQLAIEARDYAGLMVLQGDEGEAGYGDKGEIEEEIFEGKDVGGDRLSDDEFLDAAHVAHLPIAFRAVGTTVVAAHAGGCHDDRSRQAHAAVENRAGNAVHARMRIFPQLLERLWLEGVERVRRPVFEGIIREKPELRIAVV